MPDDCPTLLAKAAAYLTRQTADWPSDMLRAALADPIARDQERHIDTAALAHDTQACASACRAYWNLILSQRPEGKIV